MPYRGSVKKIKNKRFCIFLVMVFSNAAAVAAVAAVSCVLSQLSAAYGSEADDQGTTAGDYSLADDPIPSPGLCSRAADATVPDTKFNNLRHPRIFERTPRAWVS